MKTCQQCASDLGKRSKRFCSKSCANKWNGLAKAARNRDDGQWVVCPECAKQKPKNAYSFNDKLDYTKGRKAICKRCSANIREVDRRNKDWKHRAACVLLFGSRQRAKRIGMEHTLSLADINIPDVCPVLGVTLAREERGTWNCAPSLDRIDNSKGYTPENVIVVSRRANILKKDATPEELNMLAAFYTRFA